MLRVPVDHLWIRFDKAFQDEVVTESGVKLFKDVFHNPEWNTTTVGPVVAVPDKLANRIENRGRTMQARVGDKAIVSYMTVFDMEQREGYPPIFNNLHYINGEWLWKVPYFMVLGFIREEGIVPADGYVFAEAVIDEAPKTFLILPETVTDKVSPNRAKVVALGAPRKGEPHPQLEPGDVIHYRKGMAEKYEIEGKEYLIIQHHYIYGKQCG